MKTSSLPMFSSTSSQLQTPPAYLLLVVSLFFCYMKSVTGVSKRVEVSSYDNQ